MEVHLRKWLSEDDTSYCMFYVDSSKHDVAAGMSICGGRQTISLDFGCNTRTDKINALYKLSKLKEAIQFVLDHVNREAIPAKVNTRKVYRSFLNHRGKHALAAAMAIVSYEGPEKKCAYIDWELAISDCARVITFTGLEDITRSFDDVRVVENLHKCVLKFEDELVKRWNKIGL